ncbi:MAG: hypothetical protein DDT19_02660 [Syntrophomonadaceae bacterium]|nr:hypothetical protein [Bacillota bacterium]
MSRYSHTWRVPRGTTPETALKNQIKQYLKYKRFFVFPILQTLGAYKGVADLIALRKDTGVVFLEIKRPGGKQSLYQQQFQANVEAHGGKYLLVKSVDDLIKAGF